MNSTDEQEIKRKFLKHISNIGLSLSEYQEKLEGKKVIELYREEKDNPDIRHAVQLTKRDLDRIKKGLCYV